jgi:hypothetical protein
MADLRSRVQKLRAMAADTSSPAEAAIAAERLRDMGVAVSEPVGPIPPETLWGMPVKVRHDVPRDVVIIHGPFSDERFERETVVVRGPFDD